MVANSLSEPCDPCAITLNRTIRRIRISGGLSQREFVQLLEVPEIDHIWLSKFENARLPIPENLATITKILPTVAAIGEVDLAWLQMLAMQFSVRGAESEPAFVEHIPPELKHLEQPAEPLADRLRDTAIAIIRQRPGIGLDRLKIALGGISASDLHKLLASLIEEQKVVVTESPKGVYPFGHGDDAPPIFWKSPFAKQLECRKLQ